MLIAIVGVNWSESLTSNSLFAFLITKMSKKESSFLCREFKRIKS